MSVHRLPPPPAATPHVEAHTDCVDVTDAMIAYEAVLPAVGGDKIAAAIIAAAAVLTDVLQRSGTR